MESSRSSPWNVVWLILWVILAIFGSTGIIHSGTQRRQILESKNAVELRELKRRNADELSLKEQNLRAAAREAEDRRRTELETALGGPVQAAFKNPEFGLREAIHRAALAAAPTNADVRVEVDRFTEFTVMLSSERALTTEQMGAVARKFLPLAGKYLEALRFSVKGSVVAELDKSDIEYAEDWARVPEGRLATLLAREVPVETASDPAAIERLKREKDLSNLLSIDPSLTKKLYAAQKEIMTAMRQAVEDLSAGISLLDKSSSLAGVNKVRDLKSSQKDLAEAAARGKKAREFLVEPAQAWRGILTNQGVAGDALETLVGALPAIVRMDATKSKSLFEAFDHRLESGRYFLKVAEDQFGQWEFNSEFGQFGFTNQEIANRFNRAREQVIADSQELEKVLRIWNEAMAP